MIKFKESCTIKKLSTAACCIAFTALLCGCSEVSTPIDFSAKETLVIEYMNEKYGENFVISGSTGSEITWQPKDDPFREFYITTVTAQNYPDGKKYAVYNDDNGSNDDL